MASVLHEQSDGDDDTKRHTVLLKLFPGFAPTSFIPTLCRCGFTWRDMKRTGCVGDTASAAVCTTTTWRTSSHGESCLLPTVSVWQVVVKPDFSLIQSHRETLWNRSTSPFALIVAWSTPGCVSHPAGCGYRSGKTRLLLKSPAPFLKARRS